MSLYDDIEPNKEKEVAKWSSGIKLLQSQLQLKKAALTQATRAQIRKQQPATQHIAPVVDLKSKKEPEIPDTNPIKGLILGIPKNELKPLSSHSQLLYADISIHDEYNPLRPNEYEKFVKEMRKREEQKREEEERRRLKEDEEREARRKERDRDRDRHRDRDREDRDKSGSGFCRIRGDSDEEEEPRERNPRRGGAAIAPPPSLAEDNDAGSPSLSLPTTGLAVAAKIMAKYGYKEGQGLGKHEHGISTALQVEKTSKRGGRIINEGMMPPPSEVMPPPSSAKMEKPPVSEQSITEIMKNPTKVVLLRNMVGPGEVDDDLQPEVQEECQTKYGDVTKVLIFEITEAVPEEAVRIFVEFKRLESAIKAVVDLNGRYFGGRQVRGGFYPADKFAKLQLDE